MKTSDRKSKKLKSKLNIKSNPSKKTRNKKWQRHKRRSQKLLVISHSQAVKNLMHITLRAYMARTSGKLHRKLLPTWLVHT